MKENEEDIELLQNATNSLGLFLKCKGSEKYKTAIDHILSDYKRVLKENEELKDKWNKDTHKLQNDLDIANAKIIELLKDNEELKYKYDKGLTDVIAGIDLDNHYIPVQKVKDKIAELNQKIENEENKKVMIWLHKQISVLQELIEESEEK